MPKHMHIFRRVPSSNPPKLICSYYKSLMMHINMPTINGKEPKSKPCPPMCKTHCCERCKHKQLTVSPDRFPIRRSFGQNISQHQVLERRDIENGSCIHWFLARLSIIARLRSLIPFNKQQNHRITYSNSGLSKKYTYTVHILQSPFEYQKLNDTRINSYSASSGNQTSISNGPSSDLMQCSWISWCPALGFQLAL